MEGRRNGASLGDPADAKLRYGNEVRLRESLIFRIILNIDGLGILSKSVSMSLDAKASTEAELNEKLAHSGLRQTPQRQLVYQVLMENRDHPTAEEVFIRTKQKTPDISMATVYNCLDALVKCNVIKQVHLDRGASRFCPNMTDHSHFHCEQCGGVFDIDLTDPLEAAGARMPSGFLIKHLDLTLKGVCPACAQKRN